ncbi:MAG: LCP family protein, partial [Anaerolineae bacterium]|nr:LCP family protein [Anaerolineae bacterium]
MTEKKPSHVMRVLRFVVFWVLAIALIIVIGGFSSGTVQAVSRYVNEQSVVNQRASAYLSTAAAVLPTLTTNTPQPTASSTLTPTPLPSATNTPSSTPTITPSFTLTASPTTPPSATPTSQPTEMTALEVAQAFETNTPRPLAVTIPALNTSEAATIPPVPAVTDTITPTATIASTSAPTEPPTTVAVATGVANVLPTPLLPDNADPSQVSVTAIPTKVPLIDRKGNDLVNIMLLGVDSELTGDNIDRTDTMIIVSINRTTNTVSMLSLPRDLFVYIPGWTMQRLNLAFTHGNQVGWTGGGFGLLRQTIFYNFGINVHYYIEVKLSGFKQIINTLGGVNLTVDCAIQDQE